MLCMSICFFVFINQNANEKEVALYDELWKYVYLCACGIYVKIKVYMHDK